MSDINKRNKRNKRNKFFNVGPNILDVARVKLEQIGDILKTQVANALLLPNQVARSLTIIRDPTVTAVNAAAVAIPPKNDINKPSNPSLTIVIGSYRFTLVSKCAIFDRKYVNFNVIHNLTGLTIRKLTAYGSSSQVGSWRLCKMEPGNRLNKFDDYVQSTIIQWKLSRFICYWFYRHELLWDDEPIVGQAGYVDGAENRNNIRNNRAQFIPPVPVPVPANRNDRPLPPLPFTHFPQPGAVAAAIPVYYVMETRLYAYESLPRYYSARTQTDVNITCKIVDRGLGSIQCYRASLNHIGICPDNRNCPLKAPCPFDYWKNNGTCGDPNSEPTIKGKLDGFSRLLDGFYDIETINGSMVITELYSDCMVYKNFKQEAHIFKVRLKPKIINNLCNPGLNDTVIPPDQLFYKQEVDLVFVHYTIKQWADPLYEPIECDEPEPAQPEPVPAFNVQGYYVLTIIPTKVLNVSSAGITNCDFNDITDIGLFKNYIKAGYYACKPLDYKAQCIERTFNADSRLTAINLEYWFIGTRLNNQWPFYTLFAYSPEDKEALSKYSENIIFSPSTVIGGLKRQLTLPPEQENPSLNIITNGFIADDLCNAVTIDDCPCDDQIQNDQNKNQRVIEIEIDDADLGGGSNKTNKNRKRYKNKLQTYKRKKCHRRRKTMKKLKKRKTKKRR